MPRVFPEMVLEALKMRALVLYLATNPLNSIFLQTGIEKRKYQRPPAKLGRTDCGGSGAPDVALRGAASASR